MLPRFIRYTEGWLYKLEESHEGDIPIHPPLDIKTEFIDLERNGGLLIRRGFAWDGPSGPAIDTKNFMRASLVHDALYSLMRDGYLPVGFKDQADRLLRAMFIEDSMVLIGPKPGGIARVIWLAKVAAMQTRAAWIYAAVRTFARRATTPEGKNPVLTAP